MIGMMEWTCLEAVRHHLDEDEFTVGVGVDINSEFLNIKLGYDAEIADKYTIIRSITTMNNPGDHARAPMYWLTGNPRNQTTVKFPMYGSVLSRERPAQRGLPSFVAFGTYRESGDLHNNFIGPAYDPMIFQPGDPRDDEIMLALVQARKRFAGRRHLVEMQHHVIVGALARMRLDGHGDAVVGRGEANLPLRYE